MYSVVSIIIIVLGLDVWFVGQSDSDIDEEQLIILHVCSTLEINTQQLANVRDIE